MFERTQKPRANRIAFLPHTLKLDQRTFNQGTAHVTEYTIAAYWHEMKSGKPIVVFGFQFFTIGDRTLEKLEELNQPITAASYSQILGFVRKQDDKDYEYSYAADKISLNSVIKFGHAKPLRYSGMYECYYPEATGVFHDEQEMLAMQANPNYIPAGADGWYVLNKKQVF